SKSRVPAEAAKVASIFGLTGMFTSLPTAASSGWKRAANPSTETLLSGFQVRSCRLATLRTPARCVWGDCSHATRVAPRTGSPFLRRLPLQMYMFQSSHGTPRSHGQVIVVKPRAIKRLAVLLFLSQVMTMMSLDASLARPSHLIVFLPCFLT